MAEKKRHRVISAAVTTENIVSIILLCLIALVTITFCIVILLRNAGLRKENEAYQQQLDSLQAEGYYTRAEAEQKIEAARNAASEQTREEILGDVRTRLESGSGVNYTLRSMFPDQLLVARDGRYYFIPIDTSLAMNNFEETDFEKDEKGIMRYNGADPDVSGALGIDVSKFQENIDWEAVADSGVEYAFIRVGNRGTSVGQINEDGSFVQNIEGAYAAGIKVGVYFYSAAITTDEAIEEANFVLNAIEPYDVTYPVVIDIEHPDSTEYRTQDLSQEQMTDIALTFCETIEGAGYTPMIYGNLETFTLMLDMSRLEGIRKWIAYYNLPQYFPYDFDIWQYSSGGNIKGINSTCDLNIYVK